MHAKTLSRWTVLHRWTSLFCTLNLLILLLTGLPLIFHEELDEAFGYVPRLAVHGQAPMSMDGAVQIARQARPGWNPATYFEDEDHPGLVAVTMMPPGVKDFTRAEAVYLNAFEGTELKGFDPQKTPTGWLLRLHAQFFLGLGGSLYLALVGVAFFVALVSGAVGYAPFLRGVRFGDLRRDRGRRVFHLDLHNLVGARRGPTRLGSALLDAFDRAGSRGGQGVVAATEGAVKPWRNSDSKRSSSIQPTIEYTRAHHLGEVIDVCSTLFERTWILPRIFDVALLAERSFPVRQATRGFAPSGEHS